ncbi:MAG TPA: M20/M25/M40 family metallo-hydrolase [bacterium]|nr:M20/M25/M40 family metallo-hydrolase [bacterium]
MHKHTPNDIGQAIERLLPQTREFLCNLIRYPSTPGQEQDAVDYAAKAFSAISDKVEPIPIQNSIRDDEDYSTPIPDLTYNGHRNMRVVRKGSGGGQSLLFNTHLDVVPASENQENAFDPTVSDGIIRGRGACDAKGQVATLFLVLSTLKELGVSLFGDIILHLVVEEEVGGNGTLAMIRRGEKADGAIILEPTDLHILSSVRGAVWFRVIFEGRAGHSGSGGTISALKMARQVMDKLDDYHANLLAASKGIALFDKFANPMPLTFGKLSAGKWPAAAPNHAVLEGVLGFLPNKTRFQIMDEMRNVIADAGDEWLREHTRIEFMYRHDSHVLDPQHPLVQNLHAQCLAENLKSEISAMTASCDSWFYNNQLGIPTVVFGPGSLGHAHSSEEQISLDQIAAAARVLLQFIPGWCETASF